MLYPAELPLPAIPNIPAFNVQNEIDVSRLTT